MSRPTCPGLERRGNSYYCSYGGRPVNPFQWYCLGAYRECPIYVQASREAQVKPELKPAHAIVQPIPQTPTTPATIEGEMEDALVKSGEEIIARFEEAARVLNEKWSDYENSVKDAWKSWETERVKLRRLIAVLEKAKGKYEADLKEVELRKSMGLLSEDAYEKLKGSLSARLERLSAKLGELNSRIQQVENILSQHYKRLLTTTITPEAGRLRLSLARLEELYREGRISREVYERLRAELERVVPQ